MSSLVSGRTVNVVKFAVVGATGVAVNSAFLSVLYKVFHVELAIASVASYEAAVISNFILDDRWAFGYSSISWTRFVKFNAAALGGLVMTAWLLWFFVTSLGLHYLLANAAALAASGTVNLVLSVFWIWGRQQ
jgi:putative flippase GtrA